jgi:hypothetical protein
MHTTHNINVTININIQPSAIAPAKTSEQLAEEYKAAVIADENLKANVYTQMVYRQRLADWARSKFGDDIANTILGGGYRC